GGSLTDRHWLRQRSTTTQTYLHRTITFLTPRLRLSMTDYSAYIGQTAKIVGVSDDYEAVAACEKVVQQELGHHVSPARSQPCYLDVTHPAATKEAWSILFLPFISYRSAASLLSVACRMIS